ncbi:3-isopropylmalate dehydratase small subunit, partial [Erwinia amylovora]|nr:3-isopropylmalate dehydratase small subunit [Erwinia amylovora]
QLLLVTLSEQQVDELFQLLATRPGVSFTVDLQNQQVQAGDNVYPFAIDSFRRHCLLNGLDAIGLTFQHEADISAYERQQRSFLR